MLSGYEPTSRLPQFSGHTKDWKMWSLRFKGIVYSLGIEDALQADDKKKHSSKLFGLLMTCVKGDALDMIIPVQEGDGTAAWKILKGKYESSNENRKIKLMTELYDLGKKQDNEVSGTKLRVQELVQQLKLIGEEVDKQTVLKIVRRGLPDKYQQLILTLRYADPDSFSLEKVVTHVLDMDEDEQHREEEERSDGALAAKEKKQSDKNNVKCYRCGENGHYRRDCKNPMKCFKCGGLGHVRKDCDRDTVHVARESQKGSHSHSVQGGKWASLGTRAFGIVPSNPLVRSQEMVPRAATSSPLRLWSMSSDASLGETCNTAHDEVEWLVDSGATAHMTPFKEDFSSLTIKKCGTVQIGDNSLLSKRGFGEVRMRTIDSNGEIYQMRLVNVMYVPDLCIRLFSVDATNQRGHKVVFGSNGSCMQCKNGSTVNLEDRGKKKVLVARNMSAETALVTQEGNLWHRRMGRIGRDGMRRLHKAVCGVNHQERSLEV